MAHIIQTSICNKFYIKLNKLIHMPSSIFWYSHHLSMQIRLPSYEIAYCVRKLLHPEPVSVIIIQNIPN